MTRILIATDSADIDQQVRSVLKSDVEVVSLSDGKQVLPTAKKSKFDLAIVDFQIGNMGGMAVCMELRLEATGGRFDEIPVLLLLDRRPDVFLARRSNATGWLIKPLEPMRTRKAIDALLAGDEFQDESYRPNPVVVAPSVS